MNFDDGKRAGFLVDFGDERATGALIDTSTAYDWLGRVTATTDQRGVTHTYTYDSAGRLAADTVRKGVRNRY